MNRFFVSRPVEKPEGVIPYLGKGERHWRKGYSAYELAHSWLGAADGVPPLVRQPLDADPHWRAAALIEAYFERETPLRSAGRPSQTDLLARFRLADGGIGILGIEGKVEEPFGPPVADWLSDGSDGKRRRLGILCAALGLPADTVTTLRYQLLHRTAATLFEAELIGAWRAVMLVHSFSASRQGRSDFDSFCKTMGRKIADGNSLTDAKMHGRVSLQLGWVADSPQP